MSETAVAEPEVTTEPQAEPPDVTQADPVIEVGAAVSEPVQTDPNPEDPPVVEEPKETDEQRIERLADLKAAAKLEEMEEARSRELATKSTTEQQEQAWEQAKTRFTTALKTGREKLEAFTYADEIGNQLRLPPELINGLLDEFVEANKTSHVAARLEAYAPISDAAYDLLPKDQHQAFTDSANGKPPKDYLDAFAEHKALSTKAVKAMTLEQFRALSAKNNLAVENYGIGEHSKGIEIGKTLPMPEPITTGTQPSSGNSRLTEDSASTLPIQEIMAIRARQRAGG